MMPPEKMEIGAFPSEFVPVKTKVTKEWLTKYAEAIYGRIMPWSTNPTTGDRAKVIKNRKYRAGTQDPNIYRSKLQGEKDFAQLNLFIPTANPIGTFVNNIVGQMLNQGYKPKVTNISPGSKTDYEKKLNQAKADNFMLKKQEDLKKVKVDPTKYVKSLEVYETDDELELQFEMSFKDNAALALNIAIEYIFDINRFPLIAKKIWTDLVVIGKGGMAVDSYKDGRLVLRWVDYANWGCSTVVQEDYSDMVYAYEYRTVSINTLAKIANTGLTKEEIPTKGLSEEALFNAAMTSSSNSGLPWRWGNRYYPTDYDYNRPWGDMNVSFVDIFQTPCPSPSLSACF